MFPERVGPAEFEALLICTHCGCGQRALYRKPIPNSIAFENLVWDNEKRAFIEERQSICPECGTGLRRIYQHGR